MIFLVVIFALMGFVSGCGKSLDYLLLNNISEVQESVFVGSCKGVQATFITGYREEEYIKNGISLGSIPFAVLTIASEEKTALIVDNFELVIGENMYLGTLLKNPYTNEYQADLGSVVSGDSAVVSLNINGEQIDVAMLSISDGLNYGAYDAIKMVAESRGESFKPYLSKGTLCGEVYIKLLGKFERNNKDLSWGITVITRDGKRLNFVVSADSGGLLLCT